MNDLALEIIKQLEPSSGWWDADTEDALVRAAVRMLQVINSDDVEEILSSIVEAIRNECGE